jgi:hypothetical protein
MRLQVNDYVSANVAHLPDFRMAPPVRQIAEILNPYSPDAVAVFEGGGWFRIDQLKKEEQHGA